MRYLAIDLGDKRTGFAAGDDVVGLVQPLSVVEAQTQLQQVLMVLIGQVAEILLLLEMDLVLLMAKMVREMVYGLHLEMVEIVLQQVQMVLTFSY